MATVGPAGEEGAADFPFSIPFNGLVEGTAPGELARLSAPAGPEGFVRVQGDRFVLSDSGRQVRFWGTNLCFGGCFPPHDVADRMARRLACLGVNCVRFHHMDNAAYPRGIWDGAGGGRDLAHTTLHREALDRLDYLIAQLKAHGVYANLNLHVSREYSPRDGFPAVGEGEKVPDYGKGVDNFFPRCIEEQKRYARLLLGHVNYYTGKAYAEEPAVAMVEISNEDGLVWAWCGGRLDALPRAYVDELEAQWNQWLLRRYGSTDALREAWGGAEEPVSSEELLRSPAAGGRLQTLGGAVARMEDVTAPDGQAGRLIAVTKASPTRWHVQHLWGPFRVQKGATYVLAMKLRANRQDTVSVDCKMDHEPWADLGLNQEVPVGPQWRDDEFTFTAAESDAPGPDGRGGARISLTGLSKEGLEVAFAGVGLRRGSLRGLLPGEGLAPGHVVWARRRELAGRTPALRQDAVRFVQDTEMAYWQGMRDFLHRELGVRMSVTGTAVGFTTPYIAAATGDFVDSHAYWQHPRFPGRPWDPENWIVSNDVMVNSPDRSTIAPLAARRVFGLPYIVTEYNHPSPHHYEAEGFPLISTYGAAQGWDGVFSFAYCHSTEWEKDYFDNFFDTKANPVKLAVMPACSAQFRSGAVGPFSGVSSSSLGLERQLELLLARSVGAVNAYAGGVDPRAWQRDLVGVALQGQVPPGPGGASGVVKWEMDAQGRGAVTWHGRGCAGLIGFCAGKTVEAGGLGLTPGQTLLEGFSVVMVHCVGGQELGSDGRCLLTAVTRCYNRNMGWNAERNSVGRQWGIGPTLCEGVPVVLRVAGRAVKVYALNPDGTRREELMPGEPAKAGAAEFQLGPRYRTLWYELVLGG
jgi:hypothetical protein